MDPRRKTMAARRDTPRKRDRHRSRAGVAAQEFGRWDKRRSVFVRSMVSVPCRMPRPNRDAYGKLPRIREDRVDRALTPRPLSENP